MYSLCVNALFRFSIKRRPLYPLVSLRTPLPWEGRTKDVQVLIISTYDYIRNTCLHYIDELELLCIALGCDCYMMNVIQHNYPSPIQCLRFSHIDLC